MAPRRSESGHGLTGTAVLLGLLAVIVPLALNLAAVVVAVRRLPYPWPVTLLASVAVSYAFWAVVGRLVAYFGGLR